MPLILSTKKICIHIFANSERFIWTRFHDFFFALKGFSHKSLGVTLCVWFYFLLFSTIFLPNRFTQRVRKLFIAIFWDHSQQCRHRERQISWGNWSYCFTLYVYGVLVPTLGNQEIKEGDTSIATRSLIEASQ